VKSISYLKERRYCQMGEVEIGKVTDFFAKPWWPA
jgi:hypothetical protein